MAEIAITVNGRTYEIRCDDGQEEHVRALARQVDRRVAGLARTIGQAGEARLLLLAALLMADEMEEAGHVSPPPAAGAEAGRADAARLTEAVDALASRIEAIAARLSAA